ncbi:MAG: CsgG/HfaB family protein [Caulobacter sp.]|nr:CsgG/HfaB family protein [Caulobacter sp.]
MRFSRRSALVAGASFGLVGTAAATDAAPYAGLKKTIAVDPFQAAEAVGGSITSDGMTAMLTDALVRDGRFVVVERPGLASVQAEQQLGQSSATTPETAAGVGGLIGASAIVRGAVTKYEPAASGGGIGVSGLPMGGLLGGRAGVKSQTSLLEISLRLIDTTTGQVISTSKAQGRAKSTAADASVVNPWTGASAGGGTFHTSPIGQAGEDAIIKAVELIAAGMRAVAWSAQVIEADGDRVYVNAGADRNVAAGTVLSVWRRGRTFTDPTTGEVLDVDLQRIGTVRIDSVRDRLSTASVASGGPPARGDLLKLE